MSNNNGLRETGASDNCGVKQAGASNKGGPSEAAVSNNFGLSEAAVSNNCRLWGDRRVQQSRTRWSRNGNAPTGLANLAALRGRSRPLY